MALTSDVLGISRRNITPTSCDMLERVNLQLVIILHYRTVISQISPYYTVSIITTAVQLHIIDPSVKQ